MPRSYRCRLYENVASALKVSRVADGQAYLKVVPAPNASGSVLGGDTVAPVGVSCSVTELEPSPTQIVRSVKSTWMGPWNWPLYNASPLNGTPPTLRFRM